MLLAIAEEETSATSCLDTPPPSQAQLALELPEEVSNGLLDQTGQWTCL